MKKKTIIIVILICVILVIEWAFFIGIVMQLTKDDKPLSQMSHQSLVRYFRIKGVSLPEAFLQGTLLKDTVQQLENDPYYSIPFSSAEMAEAMEDIRVITAEYSGRRETLIIIVTGYVFLGLVRVICLFYFYSKKKDKKQQSI